MRIQLTVLLLMLVMPIHAQEALPTPDSLQTKCGDWERFEFPGFYVENNVWGKRDIKDFKQCLFREVSPGGSFGWEWKWPEGAPDVAAYPEVIFGWKPWADRSSTPLLPLQVSKVKKAVATYDVSMECEGVYNLSFDAWLTSAPRPEEKNITAEIMVWLDHKTLRPDGVSSETVTLEGEAYDFYHGKPPHALWPYLAFILKNPRTNGRTNFKILLDYLVKNGHVSPKDYLASIEFGNEVVSGRGKTTLKKYKVDIK